MKKYIYIGAGGFFGAILRFLIEGIHIYNYKVNIPLKTLVINISGSFLLALILILTLEVVKTDENLRLGLTIGFLGAFTTFSTMCKETVSLIMNEHYFPAIFYITISTILGLAATYLGIIVAGKVKGKGVRKKE
jgi:fluoride exporter